jgi:pimeloyl-[acyl-carrier protein] methyl ester esterase
MSYFICNGNKIFYEIKGTGKPLLFIHGWATTSNVWKPQIDYFSKNYKVICFDLVGFGKSISSEPITLDSLVRDLSRLINYLSLKKVILVGWSLGSLVSLKLVLNSAELLKSLVLVGATVKFINESDYNAGLPEVLLERLYKKIERDKEKSLKEFYLSLFSEEEKKNKKFKDILTIFLEEIKNLDRDVLLDGLRIFRNSDLRNDISNIKLPVFIIHGDNDQICPVNSANYIHSKISNSAVEIIKDTGHTPFLTKTDKFNQILEKWIRQL